MSACPSSTSELLGSEKCPAYDRRFSPNLRNRFDVGLMLKRRVRWFGFSPHFETRAWAASTGNVTQSRSNC